MRVLYVGNVQNHNVGWSMVHLWSRYWGSKPAVIEDRKHFSSYRESWPLRAYVRALGGRPWPLHLRAYNRSVLAAAVYGEVDVVHVDKGYYLTAGTLSQIRDRLPHALLFNYSLDDWFSLNPRVTGPYLRATIPYYDRIFASKRYNVEELLEAGARSASFLPCGYDPAVHHPVSVGSGEARGTRHDIVFVGTYAPEREETLRRLVERLGRKYDLKIYGNGWEAVQPWSPLSRYIASRPLLYPEKNEVLSSSKVHLNFLRKANRDTFTDRSFELPACGCFMLAERSSEHQALFEEGAEAVYFDGIDELEHRIHYYLSHDRQRREIAEAGYKRVVKDRHTYADRFRNILNWLDTVGCLGPEPGVTPG